MAVYLVTAHRPQLIVAFPGGSGTLNMRHQANEAGVPVLLIS